MTHHQSGTRPGVVPKRAWATPPREIPSAIALNRHGRNSPMGSTSPFTPLTREILLEEVLGVVGESFGSAELFGKMLDAEIGQEGFEALATLYRLAKTREIACNQMADLLDATLGPRQDLENWTLPFRWARIQPGSPRAVHVLICYDGERMAAADTAERLGVPAQRRIDLGPPVTTATFEKGGDLGWYVVDLMLAGRLNGELDERGKRIFEVTAVPPITIAWSAQQFENDPGRARGPAPPPKPQSYKTR